MDRKRCIVSEFLADHSLEDLHTLYGIKIKRHPEFSNLVHLSYDQLNSPLDIDVVKACRGLILDEDDNWNVVAYPYNKFFNAGDPHADQIDWNTANVLEKLDGSLMYLYWYGEHRWHVATSGTPSADCPVGEFDLSFADLFWRVWKEQGYELPEDKNYTYCFELCTMYNQVIVSHPQSRLVVHGCRNNITLQEDPAESFAKKYGWELVQDYNLYSLKEVEDFISSQDEKDLGNTDFEGFVVRDANFNRLKIKCKNYLLLHHCLSGLSVKQIVKIVLENENAEVLAYFPQWKAIFDEVETRVDSLKVQILHTFNQYKDVEVQKDFALSVKSLPYSGFLFQLRRSYQNNENLEQSLNEILAKANVKFIMEQIHAKDLLEPTTIERLQEAS